MDDRLRKVGNVRFKGLEVGMIGLFPFIFFFGENCVTMMHEDVVIGMNLDFGCHFV